MPRTYLIPDVHRTSAVGTDPAAVIGGAFRQGPGPRLPIPLHLSSRLGSLDAPNEKRGASCEAPATLSDYWVVCLDACPGRLPSL